MTVRRTWTKPSSTSIASATTSSKSAEPDGRRAWWALSLTTLAAGLSAPGQTIGISVFIDPMIAGLPVSRAQMSTAYLVATLVGAAALPAVGTWTDRVGVRRALLTVVLLFSIATAATSGVQGLVTLMIAFTAIRLLGQGALGVVTGTSVAVWFERRRGLAMGILATGSALLLAGTPIVLASVITAVGWRTSWLIAGVIVASVLLPLLLFTLGEQPPDRPSIKQPRTDPSNASAPTVETVSLDRSAAMRTWSFWGIAVVAGVINMLVTSVTFHHIGIMAERGLSTLEATAVFVPQMIGGLLSGLIAGMLADRLPGRVLLAGCAGLCTLGLAVGSIVTPGVIAIVYGLLIGASPGAIRAVEGALLPAWFGTTHVGSIRGSLAAITIASTAVGPVLLSLLEPATFTVGLRVLAVLAGASVVAALFVGPPKATRLTSPRQPAAEDR